MGEVRKSLFLNVCGWREKSLFGKITTYFYSVLKSEAETLNRIGVPSCGISVGVPHLPQPGSPSRRKICPEGIRWDVKLPSGWTISVSS